MSTSAQLEVWGRATDESFAVLLSALVVGVLSPALGVLADLAHGAGFDKEETGCAEGRSAGDVSAPPLEEDP